MEQVYSKISKVLAVCVVVAIVFTFVRLKTIEMPANDEVKEMKTELNGMLENAHADNEVGDVEGWAIIGQTVATGAASIATGLTYFAIAFLIIVVGVIQTLVFLFSIVFIQICKSLEKSVDQEKKWKGTLSKILFWIYIVIHIAMVLFDFMFVKLFIADAIVATGAIIYILYLYINGRRNEKIVSTEPEAVVQEAEITNANVIEEKNEEQNKE